MGDGRQSVRQIRPMQGSDLNDCNIFELEPTVAGSELSTEPVGCPPGLLQSSTPLPSSLFEDPSDVLATEYYSAPRAESRHERPEADADEGSLRELDDELLDPMFWAHADTGRPMIFRKLAASAACALVAFLAASVAAGLLRSRQPRAAAPGAARTSVIANRRPVPHAPSQAGTHWWRPASPRTVPHRSPPRGHDAQASPRGRRTSATVPALGYSPAQEHTSDVAIAHLQSPAAGVAVPVPAPKAADATDRAPPAPDLTVPHHAPTGSTQGGALAEFGFER